jgi:hypothetical protein
MPFTISLNPIPEGTLTSSWPTTELSSYFPRLHTLELYGEADCMMLLWLTRCKIPALTRLTMRTSSAGLATQFYEKFFKTRGSTIQALDVHGDKFGLPLRFLLPDFPCVPELGVDLGFFEDDAQLPIWSTLEGIVLFINFDPAQRLMHRLWKCLRSLMESHGPSLVYVRLVGRDLSDLSKVQWTSVQRDLWREWASEWKKAGVRFEFQSEELVEDVMFGSRQPIFNPNMQTSISAWDYSCGRSCDRSASSTVAVRIHG